MNILMLYPPPTAEVNKGGEPEAGLGGIYVPAVDIVPPLPPVGAAAPAPTPVGLNRGACLALYEGDMGMGLL